ncbi:MAG: glucose 1-dehydrogenase [Dehalococcoidales bacterium]|nr:MAG: glucose 1-dehydrogenase [Dehalococcoidales bacterium]
MVSEKQTLDGKVTVITGGGTGLGKAMALALAKAGSNIVVAARRTGPIEQTAREVTDLGRRALAIPTDVTDSQQVNRMIETALSEMGKINILINNAGIVRGQGRKPIWEITDEEWHLGIDTNLSSAFFCCRAVSQHFIERKSGKVINVASGEGLRGVRDNYMYCSAKGGVIQLTRTLALTWAQDNIKVNCIVPGFVDTRELQPDARPEVPPEVARASRSLGEFIPVGRLGIPGDIAALALFLASDASDYITGGIYTADGGGLAGGTTTTGYAPTIPIKEE